MLRLKKQNINDELESRQQITGCHLNLKKLVYNVINLKQLFVNETKAKKVIIVN